MSLRDGSTLFLRSVSRPHLSRKSRNEVVILCRRDASNLTISTGTRPTLIPSPEADPRHSRAAQPFLEFGRQLIHLKEGRVIVQSLIEGAIKEIDRVTDRNGHHSRDVVELPISDGQPASLG